MPKILPSILIFLLPYTPALAMTGKTMNKSELFHQHSENRGFVKSGTPQLYQLLFGTGAESAAFRAAYTELSRPAMDAFADSNNKHFRAHYDTTGFNAPNMTDRDLNGVPDYVDSTLVYLEYAWSLVIKLGYGAPRTDTMQGGSNAVDVYLEDLAPQKYYGVTYPDESFTTMGSSFLVLDNNYTDAVFPTKGYAALRVTSAHEFFHVIHYSYYGGGDAIWWMEESAVWMEDYAWDDVNDYLNYIDSYLLNRDISLDTNDQSMYGASLFAFFMAKKYGNDIIRQVWNTFRDRQSGKIDLLNMVLPEGLPAALDDLGVWLYFTGKRANPVDFLKDSALFKNAPTPGTTHMTIPAVDSLTFQRCTFKYVEISPPNGFAASDSLSFYFYERDGGIWKKEVILYNSPTDYAVKKLTDSPALVVAPRAFQKAIMVIALGSTEFQQRHIAYKVNRGYEKPVVPVPVAFTLNQNYPNPFNKETVITYYVPSESHIKLRVVNLAGQTVSILADRVDQKGPHSEPFQAAGLSSGVYLIILESGNTRITRKMLYLK
ncbi:MAG: T9SS type A sorting domain-containing protein [Candidatus Latescibacter sp.]|nr:T9SS type A sorting domain-containing protein [Candidatus Latescibacter sp.]